MILFSPLLPLEKNPCSVQQVAPKIIVCLKHIQEFLKNVYEILENVH